MKSNPTPLIIVFVFLFGFVAGVNIYPVIMPEKEITITITGEDLNVSTNSNWSGDKLVIIQNSDTTTYAEHNGRIWQDIK